MKKTILIILQVLLVAIIAAGLIYLYINNPKVIDLILQGLKYTIFAIAGIGLLSGFYGIINDDREPFFCFLGFHKWSNCTCKRCKKNRDTNHQFEGCTCAICKNVRDLEHDWNGCTCLKCKRVRDLEHDWNGCTCSKCKRVRDLEHDWNGCTCSKCKRVRDEGHDWNNSNYLCSNCKKVNPIVKTKIINKVIEKYSHLSQTKIEKLLPNWLLLDTAKVLSEKGDFSVEYLPYSSHTEVDIVDVMAWRDDPMGGDLDENRNVGWWQPTGEKTTVERFVINDEKIRIF